MVIRPVGTVVDGALLVVELGVEQHHAVKLARPPRCVVRADAAGEARTEQAQPTSTGRFARVLKRHPDVVEDGGERQLLLTTLTLTVTTEVKAQGSQASLTKPARQSREEATLLTGDTATVDQDHSMLGLSAGCNECGSQLEAVEGAKSYGLALHGQRTPICRMRRLPYSQDGRCTAVPPATERHLSSELQGTANGRI